MNFAPLIETVVQYAPAVVILLIIAYRMDQREQKWLEWCMKELADDKQGNENSDSNG